MELTHRFTVPGSVEETWARFQDIADVAQCFPGAQVTSAEGDSFEGTVKVKLGPIALVYAGSGTFTSKDEAAHRFVVEAKGRDKRGNGTAAATVTVAMDADGASTAVQVDTDLSITGKPAQFGRGVMQDVSDKLLGQFVTCLEQRGAAPPADQGTEAADQDAEPASAPTGAAAGDVPEGDQDAGPASAPPPEPQQATPRPAVQPPQQEALDLGAAVLPVLARSYWKQALAAGGVLALLVWLVRRRH